MLIATSKKIHECSGRSQVESLRDHLGAERQRAKLATETKADTATAPNLFFTTTRASLASHLSTSSPHCMSTIVATQSQNNTTPSDSNRNSHPRNSNRRRNRPPPNAQTNAGVSDAPGVVDRIPPRPREGRGPNTGTQNQQSTSQLDAGTHTQGDRPPRRRNRNRGRPNVDNGAPAAAPGAPNDDSASASSIPSGRRGRPRRGGKFNANLTTTTGGGEEGSTASAAPAERYSHPALRPDDLTSTLIHSLRTSPYPDCPICFNAIHPAQPTWSCSPSIPVNSDGKPAETGQCCWNVFHLKCIRAWASKSVKEVADAWRARGEERQGDWRCPGCQSKRTAVPMSYWCVHFPNCP
jgi:transcriptional repressor NF-X1